MTINEFSFFQAGTFDEDDHDADTNEYCDEDQGKKKTFALLQVRKFSNQPSWLVHFLVVTFLLVFKATLELFWWVVQKPRKQANQGLITNFVQLTMKRGWKIRS